MRNNPDDLSNQLVQNIKVWLETEITNYHELETQIKNGQKAIDICDQPEIFLGRYECAENLLDQIKKWEKEND
jgi:uncharacterized protein YqfB (UPF0267 family)